MRVSLHLISAPWAPIQFPSVALGALKAYVDEELGAEVRTRTYHASIEILYRWWDLRIRDHSDKFSLIGEDIYMTLFHGRYLRDRIPLKKEEIEDFISRLQKYCDKYGPVKGDGAITPESLSRLDQCTIQYVEERILPELRDDGVNVVGFSMSFNQVYSSAYLARLIADRAPEKKVMFVFGGFATSIPNLYELLGNLGLKGFVVLGEGEEKLKMLLKGVLSQEKFEHSLSSEIPGVFQVGEKIDLYERGEATLAARYNTALVDFDELPVPNYDEYCELHEKFRAADPLFARVVSIGLAYEGTRGCFAKCDFCNQNQQWPTFRKGKAEGIFEKVQKLRARYGKVPYVAFVDSVSDTYAERLADLILDSGKPFPFYMSMRAHHPEKFWAKLFAAGMEACQIGIEALSPQVLGKMSKGTSLIQNLRVLKYFQEYGIRSLCNVITHHPMAVHEDAVETLRVLEHIGHLGHLRPAHFSLGMGSPLFNRLSREQQLALRLATPVEPPAPLRDLMASGYYENPPEYQLPVNEQELWSRVFDICNERLELPESERPVFKCEGNAAVGLVVTDSRSGECRRVQLTGLKAELFVACHDGLKIEMLEQRLGKSRNEFLNALGELLDERLLLAADGHVITLATRDRAECLKRLELELTPSFWKERSW